MEVNQSVILNKNNMKYLTIGFYVCALILNIVSYGLLLKFPGMHFFELLFVVGNFLLMGYWLFALWRSDNFKKNEKIGYSFGLVLITFVYAPLIAFKIER